MLSHRLSASSVPKCVVRYPRGSLSKKSDMVLVGEVDLQTTLHRQIVLDTPFKEWKSESLRGISPLVQYNQISLYTYQKWSFTA